MTDFKTGSTAEVLGVPGATPLKPSIPETLLEVEIPKTAKAKKDPESFKKMFEKVGKINIKPFVDPNQENMGLEQYQFAVFPGIYHEQELAAIDRNGVVRFITGLDEFAPEVQNIKDPEQKGAIIYNIRSVVAYLEKVLATNVLNIEDEDFWNKVKLLRPDNLTFWSKITIRCGNEPLFLNPKKDPYDLIKMMAIEAGGFDLVAKSWEDAQAKARPPKFYLDKEADTVSTRTEYKKLRNKATSILDALFGKNPKKLTYIAKVLDGNSTQYKNSTPQDIVYDNLDEYIQGNGVERNKTRAAESFMLVSELDMETLKLKALVKDASFYKFIVHKPDGMLYHAKKSAMLGRNVSDVVEFLKNPLNEDVLKELLSEVEVYWKQ